MLKVRFRSQINQRAIVPMPIVGFINNARYVATIRLSVKIYNDCYIY